jgi:carbonic anhydrase
MEEHLSLDRFPHVSSASELTAVPVEKHEDILPRYRGSAVETFLAAHALGVAPAVTDRPELVVLTCMDARVVLNLPVNFAFQLRTAGATPQSVVPAIAFAITTMRIDAICIMGHTDCAMTRIDPERTRFVEGLVDEHGWQPTDALEELELLEKACAVDDPLLATWRHCRHLAGLFPACLIAPLLHRVEDGRVLQIETAL